MPPSQSQSPTPFARRALVLVVRFNVSWSEMDGFLDHYREWFQPVDIALADDTANGRTTEILVGDIGEEYNVIFVYRYASLDRDAFYSAYEEAYEAKHSLATGAGRQHIIDNEIAWLEKTKDCDVLHRTPLDFEALRTSGS